MFILSIKHRVCTYTYMYKVMNQSRLELLTSSSVRTLTQPTFL